MSLYTIDGIQVEIVTNQRPKVIWCTAKWKCLACGKGGDVTEAAQQNTTAGAYASARGYASMHIKQQHGTQE